VIEGRPFRSIADLTHMRAHNLAGWIHMSLQVIRKLGGGIDEPRDASHEAP
jgi:hypothetical protein